MYEYYISFYKNHEYFLIKYGWFDKIKISKGYL